jgi:tetratricopeptide (TPR) repeat protein
MIQEVQEEREKKEAQEIDKCGGEFMEAKAIPLQSGEKTKYAVYATLTVTENMINRLMNLYRDIFITDENKKKANFYKEQGLNYFDKADYQKAIDLLLMCIDQKKTKDAEVLFYLGKSHALTDKHKEAIDYLRRALLLEGNDSGVISELASCLVEVGEYQEAIECLRKAIELEPEVAQNHYLLGIAYEKTGQFEEAAQMYKKAMEFNPREPLFYHALGFMYESSGRHNDAIACFRKAMELEKNR